MCTTVPNVVQKTKHIVTIVHIEIKRKIYVKYENTDFNLALNYTDYDDIVDQFNQIHQQRGPLWGCPTTRHHCY